MGVTKIEKRYQVTEVVEKPLVDLMSTSILREKAKKKELTTHLLTVYDQMCQQDYKFSSFYYAPYIVLTSEPFDRFAMNGLVDLLSVFGFKSTCLSIKENDLENQSGKILFTRDNFQLIMDWEEDLHDSLIACFVNVTDAVAIDIKEELLLPSKFTKEVEEMSIDISHNYEDLLKLLFKPFRLYVYTYGKPLYLLVDENQSIVYKGYIDNESVAFTIQKDLSTYPQFINLSIFSKEHEKNLGPMIQYIKANGIDFKIIIDQIKMAFNDFKTYTDVSKEALEIQEKAFLGSISLLEKMIKGGNFNEKLFM